MQNCVNDGTSRTGTGDELSAAEMQGKKLPIETAVREFPTMQEVQK